MAVQERIENVVAAAILGGPFDIPALNQRLKEAQYRPDRFIGLVLNVPDGSALVFEDGHVVTTGARGVEEALAQMEHVRGLLSKAGVETTRVEGFQVRNVVYSVDLGRPVPLEQVRLALPDRDIQYDGNTFPGLIMYDGEPPVTLLVFGSGKIVATGSGDLPHVQRAVGDLVSAFESKRLLAA